MNMAHDIGAGLDRILTMELVRVTERAAVAAARLRGRGDEKAADQVAVDAMRQELNRLAIKGTVVIGEGERDEAPMLYIGEEVGTGKGPAVDIALDPLEGTTICAKNLPNALAVVALAEKGSLLNAPDVYMDKIAVGPGYAEGVIDIDAAPADNIASVAKAKGVPVAEDTYAKDLRASAFPNTIKFLDWVWPSEVANATASAIAGVVGGQLTPQAAADSVQQAYDSLVADGNWPPKD